MTNYTDREKLVLDACKNFQDKLFYNDIPGFYIYVNPDLVTSDGLREMVCCPVENLHYIENSRDILMAMFRRAKAELLPDVSWDDIANSRPLSEVMGHIQPPTDSQKH